MADWRSDLYSKVSDISGDASSISKRVNQYDPSDRYKEMMEEQSYEELKAAYYAKKATLYRLDESTSSDLSNSKKQLSNYQFQEAPSSDYGFAYRGSSQEYLSQKIPESIHSSETKPSDAVSNQKELMNMTSLHLDLNKEYFESRNLYKLQNKSSFLDKSAVSGVQSLHKPSSYSSEYDFTSQRSTIGHLSTQESAERTETFSDILQNMGSQQLKRPSSNLYPMYEQSQYIVTQRKHFIEEKPSTSYSSEYDHAYRRSSEDTLSNYKQEKSESYLGKLLFQKFMLKEKENQIKAAIAQKRKYDEDIASNISSSSLFSKRNKIGYSADMFSKYDYSKSSRKIISQEQDCQKLSLSDLHYDRTYSLYPKLMKSTSTEVKSKDRHSHTYKHDSFRSTSPSAYVKERLYSTSSSRIPIAYEKTLDKILSEYKKYGISERDILRSRLSKYTHYKDELPIKRSRRLEPSRSSRRSTSRYHDRTSSDEPSTSSRRSTSRYHDRTSSDSNGEDESDRTKGRKKVIAIVKRSNIYKRYIQNVSRKRRKEKDPRTPDKELSSKSFKRKMTSWKNDLYTWYQRFTNAKYEIECDMQVLEWRQKQIDAAKNFAEYKKYIQVVPKVQRKEDHARTPDKHIKSSSAVFQDKVKTWIKHFHSWHQEYKSEIVESQIETDERVLKWRQEKIDESKTKPEYKRYLETIPKEQRQESHPATPDITTKCSSSEFITKVKDWTDDLETWDLWFDANVNMNSNTETDGDVLEWRQKQINFGKNTPEFIRYRKTIPKEKQSINDPQTPDIHIKGNDLFQNEYNQWRKNLHKWDAPTSSQNVQMLTESDPLVLEERQMQIDAVKILPEYKRYLDHIPKDKRKENQPRTPDKHVKCFKFLFDQKISVWKNDMQFYIPRINLIYNNDKIELESDPSVLKQRQLQIEAVKNTDEYKKYLDAIPNEKRSGCHPRTPDDFVKCPKFVFDFKIDLWKNVLHKWEDRVSDENAPLMVADPDTSVSALEVSPKGINVQKEASETEKPDEDVENLMVADPDTSVSALEVSPKAINVQKEASETEKPGEDVEKIINNRKTVLENDPSVLKQRRLQIEAVKNTDEYKKYTEAIPKEERRGCHPHTPDELVKCPKFAFDFKIDLWKNVLHKWESSVSDENASLTVADTSASTLGISPKEISGQKEASEAQNLDEDVEKLMGTDPDASVSSLEVSSKEINFQKDPFETQKPNEDVKNLMVANPDTSASLVKMTSEESNARKDDFETKKPDKDIAKEAEIEITIEMLKQRQKDIDNGKNTAEYRKYFHEVPKEMRRPPNPTTPEIFDKCSSSSWNRKISLWQALLRYQFGEVKK